jgi:hypothetical protein
LSFVPALHTPNTNLSPADSEWGTPVLTTMRAGSEERGEEVEEEEEKEEVDENTKNFYRMIPQMHNLMRTLNSKQKRRNQDMGKVLSRGGNSALIGRDVYLAQRQKILSKEINAGCGFDAPPSQPYKPFENGVSFETSTKNCQDVLQDVLNRRKTFEEIQQEMNSMTEISLDQPIKAKSAQYHRKLFALHLEKFPKHQVKNKAIEFRVTPLVGDPDLFISIAEPPTEREYMWRSMSEGEDVILIHPDDPNYLFGSYYICVMCTASASEFELTARVSKPVLHDDDEVYVKAQRVMYLSIKSCIKGSDHRRRLCAGGRSVQQHAPPETPVFKVPKATTAAGAVAKASSSSSSARRRESSNQAGSSRGLLIEGGEGGGGDSVDGSSRIMRQGSSKGSQSSRGGGRKSRGSLRAQNSKSVEPGELGVRPGGLFPPLVDAKKDKDAHRSSERSKSAMAVAGDLRGSTTVGAGEAKSSKFGMER